MPCDESPLEKPASGPQKGDPGGGCSANVNTQAQQAGESAHADERLNRLIEAWPSLPEAVRAGIVAMVEASQER